MKKIILFSFGCVFFASCEEDIKLDIKEGAKKIVIEGNIENGKVSEVIVTRNSPLFATIDLSSIIVYDAKVYVSDGVTTDTLKLKTLLTTSSPFVYVGENILGKAGSTYSLTVEADGEIFTAQTTIPNPVALDSVWWKAQPPRDTLGYAWAQLSEPAGVGNAYKWFAKFPTITGIHNGNFTIFNRRFLPPRGSTFDDKYIDGKKFIFSYNRPSDPTETLTDDYGGFYQDEDTVYIKFCSIDNASSKFYLTYESALHNNGNPFASPVTIIGNINGGALGVWAGFGASYDTIMPK